LYRIDNTLFVSAELQAAPALSIPSAFASWRSPLPSIVAADVKKSAENDRHAF